VQNAGPRNPASIHTGLCSCCRGEQYPEWLQGYSENQALANATCRHAVGRPSVTLDRAQDNSLAALVELSVANPVW